MAILGTPTHPRTSVQTVNSIRFDLISLFHIPPHFVIIRLAQPCSIAMMSCDKGPSLCCIVVPWITLIAAYFYFYTTKINGLKFHPESLSKRQINVIKILLLVLTLLHVYDWKAFVRPSQQTSKQFSSELTELYGVQLSYMLVLGGILGRFECQCVWYPMQSSTCMCTSFMLFDTVCVYVY